MPPSGMCHCARNTKRFLLGVPSARKSCCLDKKCGCSPAFTLLQWVAAVCVKICRKQKWARAGNSRKAKKRARKWDVWHVGRCVYVGDSRAVLEGGDWWRGEWPGCCMKEESKSSPLGRESLAAGGNWKRGWKKSGKTWWCLAALLLLGYVLWSHYLCWPQFLPSKLKA